MSDAPPEPDDEPAADEPPPQLLLADVMRWGTGQWPATAWEVPPAQPRPC